MAAAGQPGDGAQPAGAGAQREGLLSPPSAGGLGPTVPPRCAASSGKPGSPAAQDP